MADSTGEDSDSDTYDPFFPTPDFPPEEKINHAIIRRFRYMAEFYSDFPQQYFEGSRRTTAPPRESSLSCDGSDEEDFDIDSMWSDQGLLNALHTRFLPALQEEIYLLLNTLDPSVLIHDHFESSQRVFTQQYQIKSDIDWIISSIARFCPEPESIRADDHHLNGLKSFRILRFRDAFLEDGFMADWCDICRTACELFQEIEDHSVEIGDLQGTSGSQPSEGTIESQLQSKFGTLKTEHTDIGLSAIDAVIRCLTGSDLELVKESWPDDLLKINAHLVLFTAQIYSPSIRVPGITPKVLLESKPLQCEPVIKLVRLMIPILKLSRLFFIKVSALSSFQKQPQDDQRPSVPPGFFTRMSSKQLDSLAQSIQSLDQAFSYFKELIDQADKGYETEIELMHSADMIKTRLEAAVLLVYVYVLPSMSSDSPQISSPHHLDDRLVLTEWFTHWNILSQTAIYNLKDSLDVLSL